MSSNVVIQGQESRAQDTVIPANAGIQWARHRHSGECRNPVGKLFLITRKGYLLDSSLRRNDGGGSGMTAETP